LGEPVVERRIARPVAGARHGARLTATRSAARRAGLDRATTAALVESYEEAQLEALKTAFLFAALLVIASFFATGNLPARRFDELPALSDP